MKPTVDRFCVLLLLAGILVLPSCIEGIRFTSSDGYNFDHRGETDNRQEQGEIPPQVQRLVIENDFGKVHIEVTDASPQWSWDLTCWANTAGQAQEFTQQIQLQIDQQEDQHTWTLLLPEPPVPELRGVESNLTLAVPAAVQVEVANRFGPTEIRGVQGGTVVRAEHGEVQLGQLGGQVTAATSFDPLKAEHIGGGRLENRHGTINAIGVGGDLEVDCEHGDVSVGRVAGKLKVENKHGEVVAKQIAEGAEIRTSFDEIRATDVDGDVMLRNQHGKISAQGVKGNVDAETEFGRIELQSSGAEVLCKNRHGGIILTLTGSGLRRVQAETSFSDLELNVSGQLNPAVEARTEFGKVRSGLPVFNMDTGVNNFQGLDAARPRVTLENEHGDIRVNKIP